MYTLPQAQTTVPLVVLSVCNSWRVHQVASDIHADRSRYVNADLALYSTWIHSFLHVFVVNLKESMKLGVVQITNLRVAYLGENTFSLHVVLYFQQVIYLSVV